MSTYGAISAVNDAEPTLEEGGVSAVNDADPTLEEDGVAAEIQSWRCSSIVSDVGASLRGSSSKKAICVSVIYLAAALASLGALLLSSRDTGNGEDILNTSSVLASSSLHILSSSGRHHEGVLKEVFNKKYRNHDPNKALWYKQIVDHFADKSKKTKHWDQRYYVDGRYFKGPGHPIFLVIGGEGSLEGMLYPFVNDHLAKKFGAFVVEPEHRFYGESQPVGSTLNKLPSNEELVRLLTPQQAMEDMLTIVQHYRFHELGCSPDEGSTHYCPVISVGGSYPGFLSAMMRLVYPDIIDISYAASAPLLLYSQSTDQYGYYEVVSASAERSAAGCSQAVKTALMDVVSEIMAAGPEFANVAERIGLCKDTIPEYIDSAELMAQESMMIIEDTFADANMDNYPPNDKTDMYAMCQIFLDESLDSSEGKVAAFYKRLMESDDYQEDLEELEIEQQQGKKKKKAKKPKKKKAPKCFDMRTPLPPGPNSTVSCSDWSGCGPGLDSFMWEFQECSLLTVQTGLSDKSMFPPRQFTLDWLDGHCQAKFGASPQPRALVEEWKFDDLVSQNASKTLFTNGLNDMWSYGSHLQNVSDTIIALNFPNGAHHSDINHIGPNDEDTDDLREGYIQITNILNQWLEEIRIDGTSY